ncbi:MAG: hypothetical protein AAFZ01_14710, partial [Pseudomonadota bacterium]
MTGKRVIDGPSDGESPQRKGWPTDPEMLAFIAETEKNYPPSANVAGPDEARRAYNALCKAFAVPHPPGVVTRDRKLAATNPSREIPIRHYHDADTDFDDLDAGVRTTDAKLARLFGADVPNGRSD